MPTDIKPPQSSARVTTQVVDVYPYRQTDAGPEFLLVRRAPDVPYAGTWRMIGGKIEDGEAAWEAAQRELAEETGLAPLRLWTLPSVNHFYEWEQDQLHLIPAFAAEVEGEPTLDDEHDASAWVDVGMALSNMTWPEQKRLLRLTNRLLTTDDAIPSDLIIDQ